MKLNSVELQKLYRKLVTPLAAIDQEKLKDYIYIVLTLFTVSFFGISSISPTLNTVTNLNKQYNDNMIIYNALKQKLANLGSLNVQYDTLKNNIDSVYSVIPKTTEIPKLTRQIENLAEQDKLKITKLTFGTVEIYPDSKNNPIYSFTFTVGVVGTRDDANNFIADIINFDRIIGIDRIETGTTEEKQYDLSFTGRAYFIPN